MNQYRNDGKSERQRERERREELYHLDFSDILVLKSVHLSVEVIDEEELADAVLVEILGNADERDGGEGGFGDEGAEVESVDLALGGASGAARQVDGGDWGDEAEKEEGGGGEKDGGGGGGVESEDEEEGIKTVEAEG